MKKIMILALGAAGLLGLSACGTNPTFEEKDNEPIVLRGEEGLQRLNAAVLNSSAIELNLFDKMTLETDIEYINLDSVCSGFLGMGESINSYTTLDGYSTTSFEGLLGTQEDIKFAKETLLSGHMDADVNIPLLGVNEEYKTNIDQFAFLAYYADGTFFFDVTPVVTGELVDLAQPVVNALFEEVGELIAVPVFPGYSGLTASLTNEKAQLIVSDIPTTKDPLLTDEEKEQIEEFFKTYPQVARNFLGQTLSEIFTVTLEEDSAKLDINLTEELIDEISIFLEEYVGVSVDVKEYIPEDFDLKLSIFFNENMLPTSLDTTLAFSYEIPDYYLTGKWSSHSTTEIFYEDCQFVSDCGAKIEILQPVTNPDEDDDEDIIIF